MKIKWRTFSAFALFICAATFCQNPAAMAVNTWMAIPNTPMRAVAPSSSQYPNIQGNSGVAAVMSAWCGGAFDTKRNRLIIWGGGHGDYFGNELYAFSVDSMKWSRITEPCANPTLSSGKNADNTPAARHTYNQVAYAADADLFFACGGSRQGDGGAAGNPCVFNFDTKAWTYLAAAGAPPGGIGSCCAYDPVSHKVFYADNYQVYWGNGAGLYSYDFGASAWTKHNSNSDLYYYTLVVDPGRRLLLAVGNGNVYAYNLANIGAARQTWATTGGDAFVSKSNPGLAYDPLTDRIVGWGGGSVYALNPDTRTWTACNATGAPAPSGTGTYGRWQYVPSVNAFINVNSVDGNVYFYKFSAGTTGAKGGTGPVPGKNAVALQASPNPFRASTALSFVLAGETGVSLRVFNPAGRLVAGLVKGSLGPGGHCVAFSAAGLPSGVYVCELSAGGRIDRTRLLVTR